MKNKKIVYKTTIQETPTQLRSLTIRAKYSDQALALYELANLLMDDQAQIVCTSYEGTQVFIDFEEKVTK